MFVGNDISRLNTSSLRLLAAVPVKMLSFCSFKATRSRSLVQARIRIISVYVTASGTVPFDDWMNDVKDYVGKGAVEARIARLRLGALGKTYERG